ncbi:MAG: DUF507 family protein [Acidobacteria bacterium]|nr:DUF507 family protein [Acidobacteriota bacterium]
MLLPKEFVSYIATQLIKRLTPTYMEAANPAVAAEITGGLVLQELEVEDKLNDDVRDLLSQYSEYMRREGISYQEMFKKIKTQMIRERKIVRASGRDTGDSMKLSRDKITDISHKLVAVMRKGRDFRLKKDQNEVRLEIVRTITDILQVEDKADRAARQKIRAQKREIVEGADEWAVLHRRYYADELRKLGIEIG